MLKLPSDSIMGKIHRIKYENNRIYVSDTRSIFVFSDDGELESCIMKRGRGPGEYSSITDFMVDGETITVLDRSQKRLLTYDHAGETLSTRNLDYFAQAISPMIDYSFFLYYFDSRFSHYLRRVNDGREDSIYIAVADNQVKSNLLIFSVHNFYKYDNTIYFSKLVNDTVYKSIGGGNVKPFFRVDFKGKSIPSSFLNRQIDVMTFADDLYERSYAFGVNNFALYDRFLMFNTFYKGYHKLTVFDRINEIPSTYAAIRDDIYFEGLTISISDFKYFANSSIFVPLDSFDVFEWKNMHPPNDQYKEMVNATEEEDNPLLLIFDFKQ